MKASIKLEHQLLAVETEHRVHAMLELTTPAPETDDARLPLRLALVLDRSGSMAGPKLEHTQAAAAYLIKRLAPKDKLALITYDDVVDLIAPLDTADKSALLAALAYVYPRGSTNLSGGWLKGVEALRRNESDAVRKVLLLTDGLANQGVTNPGTLVNMAGNALRAGIGTTTIGFGDDFNEELLTAMADSGHGGAHYAASPEDAPGIFAEEFDDLVSLVAQNVSVEIRPSSEVALLGILNEYPQVGVPGGVQIEVGDAFAEETRRVVFELHIPEVAALGRAKVADIVLRYTDVGDEIASHEVSLPLFVNLVSADEADAEDADPDVKDEVLVLKIAKAQRDARLHTDPGTSRLRVRLCKKPPTIFAPSLQDLPAPRSWSRRPTGSRATRAVPQARHCRAKTASGCTTTRGRKARAGVPAALGVPALRIRSRDGTAHHRGGPRRWVRSS